ncbi:S8 family serine peptidase [Clostridium sp. B9]|uniref:S8 family serine peptidase n=1 Tax=Clostridium sp. B9 TaxID=3423224 RepID=UPI003D2EA101
MFSMKHKLDSNLKIYINRSYYTKYRVLIRCKKFMKDMIKKIPQLKGTVVREINSLNLICAILTPKAINRLIEYPEIEFISFDEQATLCGLSIGTANRISANKSFNFTGRNVSIGLVDSGVYPHQDLLNPRNKIEVFLDLLNNLSYPYDDNGHGTAISGILCGSGYSSQFVFKGVAENSKLSCVKAFDASGKGFVSDILFAIESLITQKINPIKVLCLPFELTSHNTIIADYFNEIFKLAVSKNIIPVVPSGSLSGEDTIKGFALSPWCITVGGFDSTRTPTTIFKYSSMGSKNLKKPDFSAACANIMCLNSDKQYISERNGLKLYPHKLDTSYVVFQGTSLACAYISGVCALLLESKPDLTYKDLCSLLKIASNNKYELPSSAVGEGVIDLSFLLENI